MDTNTAIDLIQTGKLNLEQITVIINEHGDYDTICAAIKTGKFDAKELVRLDTKSNNDNVSLAVINSGKLNLKQLMGAWDRASERVREECKGAEIAAIMKKIGWSIVQTGKLYSGELMRFGYRFDDKNVWSTVIEKLKKLKE